MENGNLTFTRNFSNNLTLSGSIVEKPTFKEVVRKNGQVSKWCCFYLTQNIIGFQKKIFVQKFFCRSRSPQIIEELKKFDRQIYVTCLGKLEYMFVDGKAHYYPLIEEMQVEALCDERMIVHNKEKKNEIH